MALHRDLPNPRTLQTVLSKNVKKYLDPTITKFNYRRKYGSAAPNIYKIVNINPQQVDYLLCQHFWESLSRYTTHIEQGEWDVNERNQEVMLIGKKEGIENHSLIHFDNYILYQSAKRRIQMNEPWENTRIYKDLIQDRVPKEFSYTSDEVMSTLNKIDTLCESMRKEGYKQQKDISEQQVIWSTSPCKSQPEVHEVAINIGRDGKLIFDDGRHRFIVAKALGLKRIPTRIFVRHERWQEHRQQISDASSVNDLSENAKKYIDHPDIRYLSGSKSHGFKRYFI